MILAFKRWIICVYEQVPRDMDVFCVRTQIFLKNDFGLSTLDYLRIWASTHRDMDVFCVHTQKFLKWLWPSNAGLFVYMSKYLETSMYCAYVHRYSKKCFLIFQLLRTYRELYKSLFGISAHTQKIHISIKVLRVCANNPKLEDSTIQNHH